MAEPSEAEILRDVLVALLDARTFLGIQLSMILGEVDEATYDDLSRPFLRQQAMARYGPDLIRRARVLQALVPPERFDADFLSTALRCDYVDALRIVQEFRVI